MNMFDALSLTDIISLILLILIAIIVFRFSVSGNQVRRSAAGRDSALTGGDQIEPDPWFQGYSATDTNDPVLLTHNSGSRYAGPNQTALALENATLFDRVQRNLQEITRMKNLMDNVLDSMDNGVITTDVVGKITLFNQAAESILNMPLERCIGLHYAEALPSLANTTLFICRWFSSRINIFCIIFFP